MALSIMLRILVVLAAVLPLCHRLGQGAALSHVALRRQVEEGSAESDASEVAAEEPLSSLKAGVLVLKQATSSLPLPAAVSTLDELFAFERSVNSVCMLLEFAATLERPATVNNSESFADLSHLRNILAAIRINSCTWMKEAFGGMLGGGEGSSCSSDQLEVLCTKRRLYFLADSVAQELQSYKTTTQIDVAKWMSTFLHPLR